MKKIYTVLIMVFAAGIVCAQSILEGYAPVASPSGAYRYIRTVSDTTAGGKGDFDIVDIKTDAKLTNSANTSELKVYGAAKATNADMDTLNVGKITATTGGYAKAKINKADKASTYTVKDAATVTTYKAELNGSGTSPTLNLSNTKAFPNALPGTDTNALLSTIGKNMEWKSLKDTAGNSHTILVINISEGSSESNCEHSQKSNCEITGGSYNSSSCSCSCPAGRTLNPSTYECEDTPGCGMLVCTGGRVPDASLCICVCPAGTEFNLAYQECLPFSKLEMTVCNSGSSAVDGDLEIYKEGLAPMVTHTQPGSLAPGECKYIGGHSDVGKGNTVLTAGSGVIFKFKKGTQTSSPYGSVTPETSAMPPYGQTTSVTLYVN
ncbi:hypothetical protein Dip518_000683 [Parelusimicrobium proximum]|uniref:hypothetical protein n=1 Tax=Parelusimicrobium proximum TaxID=3228953 RepID=UPI003D16BEAD